MTRFSSGRKPKKQTELKALFSCMKKLNTWMTILNAFFLHECMKITFHLHIWHYPACFYFWVWNRLASQSSYSISRRYSIELLVNLWSWIGLTCKTEKSKQRSFMKIWKLSVLCKLNRRKRDLQEKVHSDTHLSWSTDLLSITCFEEKIRF